LFRSRLTFQGGKLEQGKKGTVVGRVVCIRGSAVCASQPLYLYDIWTVKSTKFQHILERLLKLNWIACIKLFFLHDIFKQKIDSSDTLVTYSMYFYKYFTPNKFPILKQFHSQGQSTSVRGWAIENALEK
jgi:hypothetical protein